MAQTAYDQVASNQALVVEDHIAEDGPSVPSPVEAPLRSSRTAALLAAGAAALGVVLLCKVCATGAQADTPILPPATSGFLGAWAGAGEVYSKFYFNCSVPLQKDMWAFDTDEGQPLDVKVLTYNLFWWNLYGLRHGDNQRAGKVIAGFSESEAFDLLAFQECINGSRILQDAGLEDDYLLSEVHEGCSKDVCIAYRNSTWDLLDEGNEDVAADQQAQWYGNRTAQYIRLQHKETNRTVLFVNHHGPLPLSSGGACGGQVTAWKLLGLIHERGMPGDAVILTGDFNAGGDCETIKTLGTQLSHVFQGTSFGGVDNFFTNMGPASLAVRQNMGPGGSDHDALTATFSSRALDFRLPAVTAAEQIDVSKPTPVYTPHICKHAAAPSNAGYRFRAPHQTPIEGLDISEAGQTLRTLASDARSQLPFVADGVINPEGCCALCHAGPQCEAWSFDSNLPVDPHEAEAALRIADFIHVPLGKCTMWGPANLDTVNGAQGFWSGYRTADS